MAGSEKKEDRTTRVLILIFLILAAGIVLTGYLYYTAYAKRYRFELERQLFAIADLKAAELNDWRRERIGDAQVFYRNDVFSRLVRHYLENPGDENVNRDLRLWLGKYQVYYQYDRIMLLDKRYRKRLVIPDRPERPYSFVSPSSSRLLKSGKMAFEDFYFNKQNQRIYLKILVPVFEGNGSNRMIAVLAFRIDPDTYLYPYINSWPIVSRTAETMLARREGNEVVFLNELRFQKNTALKLRFPLDRQEMPAAKAALGREGIVEGRDYRDVPVIAALRAVPDSPWFLVARMDASEVRESLRERLWMIVILVGTLLVGAGAGVGLVWRHQRARFYREKFEASEALRESEERYRSLFENSLDAVLLTSPDGRILAANAAACEMLGRTEEELCQIARNGVFDTSDLLPGALAECVHAGEFRGELTCIRKDGTRFSGEVSTAIFTDQYGHERTSMFIRDISERKKAEDVLRQSEENFRRTLDESPLGVRIVTAEGETLYVNRALLDIYGYDSVEELKNTPVEKRYTLQSYLEFQTRREQRRRGFEDPSEYAISIIRKDGSVRHLQVYRKEILWNNKRQYQALYLDITEQKRAEDALRGSEEQFRLLAEQSLMAIGIIQDGVFKYFNKAFEEINGYSADEIRGWRPFEFSSTIHPDDRNFVMDQIRRKQAGHPDIMPHYFFRIIHKDGDIRWIEIYSRTVTYKENPADLITLIDVTERKKTEEALRESEERYRTLVESTRDLIYTTDKKWFITYMNPSLEKVLGYNPHEMNGRSFAEILAPEFVDKARDIFRRVMRGEYIPVYEAEMVRKNGTRLFLEFNAETLYDSDGKPSGRYGIGRDITDRRRAEDELKQSYQRLRALAERLQQIREESRITIAREIHDELGGGLTGLKMDLSWLSQKIAEEKAGEDHDPLMKRIRSAGRLIDRLIQNVRLIGTRLRPSVLDDLGLIAALEWESEDFANRTGIQCEFVPAFDYVKLEDSTATAVFRIFQEALTNVARHSGADKVTVLFSEDDGYLCLEVVDNGRGITEGEILDMKSLGILGMRERAQVFGGELLISGEHDKGTTVVLRIPQEEKTQQPA